jgi:hypothetical protein
MGLLGVARAATAVGVSPEAFLLLLLLLQLLLSWDSRAHFQPAHPCPASCQATGIVAAALGASEVVLTDLAPNLELLRDNCAQNCKGG